MNSFEVVRKLSPGPGLETLAWPPDGSVVDVAASGKVLKCILVGDRVWQLTFSADGKTLYAANGLSNDVSVIDVDRMKVTKSVPVGRLPWGLALRP